MMKNCVLKPSVDTQKWMKAAGISCCDRYGSSGISSRLEDGGVGICGCRRGVPSYIGCRHPRSEGR